MKVKANKIILAVVIFALIAVMIAVNIVLASNAAIIHAHFDKQTAGDYDNTQENASQAVGTELIEELAEQSIVMLRNENDTLPLNKKTQNKVNLFGWASSDAGFLLVGGGSGGSPINDDTAITLQEALKAYGISYNPILAQNYDNFSSTDADKNSTSNTYTAVQNPDESFYTDSTMSIAKNYSDVALVVISRYASENGVGGEKELYNISGYADGSYLELTENEKLMFEKINEYGFEDVIVLLNVCNPVECGFLEDYGVDACLYVGMPGQTGANAIPRVLYGDVTPSGRISDLFAYDWQTNNPVIANNHYANSSILYAEGIYYGYRWYETADVEGYFEDVSNAYGKGYDGVVQFPFGYGLSYADFEYKIEEWPSSALTADGKYQVKVRVTNNGNVTGNTASGKETVQLYVTPQYNEGEVEKSHVALVAFGKTAELEPGESQLITLTFDAYDLASYDSYDANNNEYSTYEIDAGDYVMKIMSDSHNVVTSLSDDSLAATFTMHTDADIIFDKDPTTQATVENRLTGENAYGGVPIDGTQSSAKADVEKLYMSRADGFADFPTTRAQAYTNTINNSFVGTIDASLTGEVASYEYGNGGSQRLFTLEDGSAPTSDDLSGKSGNPLVYNDELFAELRDYKSDIWKQILDQMTEGEVREIIGFGGFRTSQVTSIGKPLMRDMDGPAGFNNSVSGGASSSSWITFPSESLIACSWSAEMCYYMGMSQGLVANNDENVINGWYAPGANLHRSPYNSRNFEYYSEDPVLSGICAAEVIRGAKNNNLYCYMKHFAASEAGGNPFNKNTWLTEQTFREIYLKPFEIAVKEGGANAIMSAFNNIGNIWIGANGAICTEILRDEWGFRGSMITDYYHSGYMNVKAGIIAGNDLYLSPGGNSASGLNLDDATTAYAARRAAKNILYTLVDTYMAAKEYRDSGSTDDRFNVEIGKFVPSEAPFSALFVFLWVLIDAAIAGGIVVSVIFFLKKPKTEKTIKE